MEKIKTELEKQIYSDIQEKVWNYYDKNGIICKKNEAAEDTLIDFLAFLSRRISMVKRKVFYSWELKEKMSDGTLSDELIKVLKLYENAFITGKDMNIFLSNNTKNARQPDLLLYTWKLYHLHMSGKFVDSPKQMKNNQSDTQLLCVIDEETAYFVDVVPHPEKGKDNFSLDHLKILKNNGWLEKIGFVEGKDVISGTLSPIVEASDDIFDLYRGGCNTAFQLDGGVYVPVKPIMTNLRPIETTKTMMEITKKILGLEREFSGCAYKGFRMYTCQDTGRVHGVIDLELSDGTLYMVLLFY